jgi:hypothetical protein
MPMISIAYLKCQTTIGSRLASAERKSTASPLIRLGAQNTLDTGCPVGYSTHMRVVTLVFIALSFVACGSGGGSDSPNVSTPDVPTDPGSPTPTPSYTPPPGVTPVSGINCQIDGVGANNVAYRVVYSRTMYSDGSLANACSSPYGVVQAINCSHGDPTLLTFNIYAFSGGQNPFYFWQPRSFNLTAGSPFCTSF